MHKGLHNSFVLRDAVMVIKYRSMSWPKHVA